mgnify:CR=1 FL=1
MPRYAMVIDERRCIGCMACIDACKAENDVAPTYFRTRVRNTVEGKFPHLRQEFRSELCNHCDNPPCVYNCPTGASYKDQNTGMVLLAKEKCIGCKACIAACPYDARYVDHEKGVVDKCTFCSHRVAEGKMTACVTTCVGGSRIFGDLDDPNSTVAQLVKIHRAEALLPDAGTEPRVFYIKRYAKPV